MSEGPVGVLVVDDHGGFRAAVATMLSLDERLALVGEADSPAAAVSVFDGLRRAGTAPGLVLIDVNLGSGNGMDLATTIVTDHPGTAVVTCSTAPLAELPALPSHPDITFVAKADLEGNRLWAWYRHRRR